MKAASLPEINSYLTFITPTRETGGFQRNASDSDVQSVCELLKSIFPCEAKIQHTGRTTQGHSAKERQFLGDINFGASYRSSGRWPCLFVVLCWCLKLNEEIIYGRRLFSGDCWTADSVLN